MPVFSAAESGGKGNSSRSKTPTLAVCSQFQSNKATDTMGPKTYNYNTPTKTVKKAAKSSNAVGKMSEVSPFKDVVIKQESFSDEDDDESVQGGLSLSSLLAKVKGNIEVQSSTRWLFTVLTR